MIIYDQIVKDYIDGEPLDNYKGLWFYKSYPNSFQTLSYDQKERAAVNRIYEQCCQAVMNFVPCNEAVWTELFPEWQKIISDIRINLIVGLPEPNDAMVLKDPDGKNNVILDLSLWTKYEMHCNIKDVVHNLLTHELCHVCIGQTVEEIDDDLESGIYLTALDANTFHEGFAHLLSFENSEINKADWQNEKWRLVAIKSKKKMKKALTIMDEQVQKSYLHDAVYGSYEDKFACMCGMFFLQNCHERQGVKGLKKIYEQGYHGFAERTVFGWE